MKLLMFFLCIFKVSAATYYSNYTKYIESNNYIESNELREVKIIDNSKYYIYERTFGGYFIEDENDINYPIIDKNNFVTETFTSAGTPNNKKNRVITSNTYYLYSLMWPIRYIKIDNGNIIDIEVFEHDEKIPITIINNNQYVYNYDCIIANNLIIDLRTLYNLDNLKIKIIYKDSTNTNISIYDNLEKEPFISKKIVNSKGIYTYLFDDFELIKPKYSSPNIYENTISHNITTKEQIIKNYYITDYKYAYYKETKTYVDNSNLKEEDIHYYYRTRNYINIDPINITNYGITPLNFITSSTNYTITDNINYLKNGKYKVLIKMDDIEIIEEAIVNNPANDILEHKLLEYDTTISNSEKLIKELNYKINQKDLELKQVINLDNEKIETLKSNNIETFKKEEEKTMPNKTIITIFIIIILVLIIERLFREKYS